MTKGNFILVNGSFFPSEDYRISVEESEVPHFSEQFRSIKNSFPFFRPTLDVIKLKLLLFNGSVPELTNEDGAGLKRLMERTLTKNKHFGGAKVTLTFRFSGEKVAYTIQSETTETVGYELNEKGLFAEIFDKIQKPASSLTTLSLGSAAYWDIAGRYRSNPAVDEFIILGYSDAILETAGANIYLIKGRTVLGPSSEDGAYIDVTKQLMMDIFCTLNLFYSEDREISVSDLETAEEIFLVNAILGIRWIIGVGEKRYFNNTTRKISELFKQLAIS